MTDEKILELIEQSEERTGMWINVVSNRIDKQQAIIEWLYLHLTGNPVEDLESEEGPRAKPEA